MNIIPVLAVQSSPENRYGSRIVFDSSNNDLYLFGGQRNTVVPNSLDKMWKYSFEINSWEQIPSEISPSARIGHGMVLIPTYNAIFLFGGMLFPNYERDSETWIFNITTQEWIELETISHPLATSDFGIVYNDFDDCVYIWGGYHENGHYDSLWQFNLTSSSWIEIPTFNTPAGRYGHSLIYNQNDTLAYLFGGRVHSLTNTLWALNFTSYNWEPVSVDTKPIERYWHQMVYIEQANQGFLFGGDNEYELDDTWEFNFNTKEWNKQFLSISPEARNSFSMVNAISLNKVLLYGGLGEDYSAIYGELWEYDLESNEWSLVWENENLPIWIWFVISGLAISIGIGLLFLSKHRKRK